MSNSWSPELSLAGSEICLECDVILKSLDKAASEIFEGMKLSSHGRITLGTALTKVASCHLCSLFVDCYNFEKQAKLKDEKLEITSHLHPTRFQGIIHLAVGEEALFTQRIASTEVGSLSTYSCDDWRRYESFTWSPRASTIAREWLGTCNANHKKCSDLRSAVFPTRLIDIGLGDTFSPKLVNGCSISASKNYITLSHCWGGGVPLCLKQDNMMDFMEGVDYDKLPKTFQHALIVTKDLGCRYIWIDSLCIIQDSKQDWLHESSKMGQVYSYAYCNIAASAASDSNKGLFYPRQPYSMSPLRVTLNQKEYAFWPSHASINKAVDESILNSRAWVYQERFLSPRIIHFTASQIFWECRHHSASELEPNGLKLSLKRARQLDIFQSRKTIDQPWDTFKTTFILWNDIIKAYSSCGLTKSSDRLVAISGVAAEIYNVLESDDYLAGMWRKHLPYSLTWKASGQIRNPATSSYMAPSWSWASIERDTLMTRLSVVGYECCVEVLRAEVVLVGSNKFGQVRDGFLELKGGLISTSLPFCHKGPALIRNRCLGCLCRDASTTLETSVHMDIPIHEHQLLRNQQFVNTLHFPALPIAEAGKGKEVFLMPVLGYWRKDKKICEGLVLQATGKKNGEFQRIGMFEDEWERDEDDHHTGLYLTALNNFRARAEALVIPSILSDKTGLDVEYVFTIV